MSQAPRLGFIGGFDGVRGIGILMVLFNHAYSDLSPSFAGIIDVFFVMSAFLIVTLLLQEHRDHDHIDMRKFYSRRVVRLLPSAYLCILAWIVFCLLFDRDRLIYVLQDAAAAVTYIYNLVFPVGLPFVDATAASHRSIDQFWSLAVEEQFYLVIAITVLVCLRKKWMTQLAIVMVVLATAIGIARWTGSTGPWPFTSPTNSSVPARGISLLWLSRYDSLMWGVALAVLNAHLPEPLPDRWRRWLPRVGAVGMIVASVMMLLSSKFLWETTGKFGIPYPYVPMAVPVGTHYSGKLWIQFGHTVTALAFMPALLAMARCKSWKLNVWLSWKPLRFLGRMSYTVYVWHTFFYFIVLDTLGGNEVLGQKWRAPILAVIAVVCSLPIFYGVEQRMLRVKLRFASEKEVLDLNTGKMISVEEALAQSGGARSPVVKSDKAKDSS
ncbi:MAG TPA: acyltransferase [Microthrixaceae bacterium]|nr:acyltransferase [Microthrixaceae bacterium]